jgi:GTP-binding protein
MFIDEVEIKVISGKWWDGLVSWRREKYIPKWGPWGGDWWDWASVYLETTTNLNTLSEYRHRKLLAAEKGERWWTNTCHWANAEDLILKIPVWTIVTDINTGARIADLDEDKTRFLLVKWWKWGFWNAHFCSSTRQAPAFAELWDVVQEKDLRLELKLVADIWIIGIPSAGKSTLITKITNVEAKIGDYPFTTLVPNLWVLDHKGKSLVLEDVPWLIPWASEWKGLWVEFLKHIERTGVLVHLLDSYRLDKVFSDYVDIRKELELFSDKLKNKEEIVVFSKSDLLDDEIKEFILSEFKSKYKDVKVFMISSATWYWIEELKDFLIDNYSKEEVVPSDDDEEKVKMYNLKDVVDPRKVTVSYEWDLLFKASWERLEQIVRMTDFDNIEAVMRVYNVLDKMMVIRDIEVKLEKIMKEEEIDNSFFFEWSVEKAINPRVIIAGKTIDLNKLKYNL